MKRLVFLLLVAAAAQAAAQATRQFEAGKTADLDNWLWRARQRGEASEAEKAIQGVAAAVARKDCPGAVAALNAGLAKGHGEVMLLAGTMFEEGLCVRQSWDRAVSLYQRALESGQPTAAARLSAGYAAPVGGSDKAAALWWATKAKIALPPECGTLAAFVDDPDRFVAGLKAWPAPRIDACVYAAALMSSLYAEADAPGLGAAFGLTGAVRVTLLPEQRRFEITPELADDVPATGRVAEAADADVATRRRALVAHLQFAADRALARYSAPSGVPAAWRMQAQYVYKSSR